MADAHDKSLVPTWDGQARTWRKYTREVSWFIQSTPVYKRRYCASKLLTRLSGPARLLAMSWSKVEFDSPSGTKLLLQRLASSPLERRSLPNAADICQQYFSFRRQPGESIGNFLVRETLVHEEFVESIIRLHEEKLGVSQADRDFGLPEEPDWKDDPDWVSWYNSGGGGWGDEDYEDQDTPLPAPDGDSPQDDGAAAAPPERRDDPPPDATPARGATGSSPSHRQADAGSVAPKTPLDEMSVADSFIMDVLRGWRLLQAAGLSAEEKRDILSSTKNSLDHSVISSALQSLWDDQLLGGHRAPPGHYNAHYADTMDESYLNYQHEGDDWWYEDDTWWHDEV